jgi:predicted amidophosphoribosyltransferase
MKVNVRQMQGPWDAGYSLDKHTISSTYLGDDEYGHPQFDTTRSEVGEALFRLKYRADRSQAPILAAQMATSLGRHFSSVSVVVPMPPSKHRAVQPVAELARHLAAQMDVPCGENLLVKTGQTAQMKDIASRDDRVSALCAAFVVYDVLSGGRHDVLIVDDLFDTGSSLEAATKVLRGYSKVGRIFVATVTRKSP